MHTADDDSVPVPHDAFTLPRPVLWTKPPARGVVWQPPRDELEPEDTDVSHVDALPAPYTSPRAATDALDDEPTIAIQVPIRPPAPASARPAVQTEQPEGSDALQVLLARGAAYLNPALTRAAQLWREGPLRTAAMVAGAVLITYLAVSGARRGSDNGRTQMVLVPAVAPAAAAPIIVQQLDGAPPSHETAATALRSEQSDKAAKRVASARARATSFATPPASKSSGYQMIAAKPKSSRTERPGQNVSNSSAGLPAWGADAVRDFSNGKSSGSATSRSQAPTAKPTSSNADIPPPMASYRASPQERPQPAPAVAAKPAEPPKPVAPPAPRKPLTMDQVLNQVEEAAQAQRKQAGLKAPKTSKHDAELDELINGAMKSKAK